VKLILKYTHFIIMLAALFIGAGCGGISASRSVSPLDFLLPGILKVEPKQTPTDPTVPQPNQPQQVALVQ
jgi:hypothetical protein